MANKTIDILFVVVVITFLAVTLILMKDYNEQSANDFKDHTATLTNIVRQKNDKIKSISEQLMTEVKQNEDLRNTLTETRNSLESLSKKLTQPAVPVVAAPAVPVAASAVPAAKPAPVATATK